MALPRPSTMIVAGRQRLVAAVALTGCQRNFEIAPAPIFIADSSYLERRRDTTC